MRPYRPIPTGDLVDWLALNAVEGIGPRTVKLLLERFSTPSAVLEASRSELQKVGLRRDVIDNLQSDGWRERAKKDLAKAEELGVTIITISDEAYPAMLKEIYDPPPLLYVKGDLNACVNQPCLAVVGSRHCSTYGQNASNSISREVAANGVTIVSGLARGIDTAAHEGALAVGGKTIAVFGTGLDTVYPKENAKLADQICEMGGAIISELSFETAPTPMNFPFRNRIISGLSFGVLIVEGAERSGSLITARLAYEQGREVFAIPGNITSKKSFGPNYLIKDGAKLVQTSQDIIEELPREARRTAGEQSPVQASLTLAPPDLSDNERLVLGQLSMDEPQHIDNLLLQSQVGSSELFNVLLMLEMKDCIRQLPGKKFVRLINI
ncbi:MAG TPA: DNA-processing protein DprA [Blastocatellia bacterium]|nr:DNA-processing protein DprA [Blastocatellia bacterium]